MDEPLRVVKILSTIEGRDDTTDMLLEMLDSSLSSCLCLLPIELLYQISNASIAPSFLSLAGASPLPSFGMLELTS